MFVFPMIAKRFTREQPDLQTEQIEVENMIRAVFGPREAQELALLILLGVLHLRSDLSKFLLKAHLKVHAMDLMPFMVEMLGITLPMVDVKIGEDALDEAENAGIPPDTCTLPRISLGMALKGHFPPPLAMVASNSPCDGGMSSYAYLQKLSGAPTFRLDLPYRFKEERAVDYYESETGGDGW